MVLDWDDDDLSDDELVAMLCRWNVLAGLVGLRRRHRAAVWARCVELVGEDGAEELCEEAFTAAALRVWSLDDPARFCDWVFELAQERAAAND